MEKAKKEHCPKCKGTMMINNVYVKTGENIKIYVECANCHSFVARYSLLTYTSDKPYEILLQKLKCLEYRSGKKALRELEEFDRCVESEFKVVKSLAEQEEAKTVEDLIKEKWEERE
uniref:Uncharacterized protein n=1 Tax=candidate division WOR-3 bacterium TaxID=2052148 RepID=A0A7C6AAH8_UNCW3